LRSRKRQQAQYIDGFWLQRFNGAVTLRSRKPVRAGTGMVRALRTELQWGRDLAVTETGWEAVEHAAVCRLQWGRDLAVTETRTTSARALLMSRASMGP
jgi:hypothetical protein